eukprot:CAMPEP_0175083786 /NCGR_PEP_ID=MMETSP0052_2-20121109/27610_1 /TAXON_ID=51329 ORGANISM="Polytomella parva, Strain SAG 63-3" /NCGR_SAMPLE_ID=MMETSP0052_2 /ASSEMBLY_ACC=CAM_ASM_000194 /LENGTH=70 /DNA_ID=CAMNT_0016355343 /DNA_START=27 /DNA_END=235 /DNA_ORIENTATION=+
MASDDGHGGGSNNGMGGGKVGEASPFTPAGDSASSTEGGGNRDKSRTSAAYDSRKDKIRIRVSLLTGFAP